MFCRHPSDPLPFVTHAAGTGNDSLDCLHNRRRRCGNHKQGLRARRPGSLPAVTGRHRREHAAPPSPVTPPPQLRRGGDGRRLLPRHRARPGPVSRGTEQGAPCDYSGSVGSDLAICRGISSNEDPSRVR
jgi:hypothetical protein